MKKSEVFIGLSEHRKPEELFPASVCFTAEIDGRTVQNKENLMKAVSSAFHFPAYFGNNWDAMLDCLRSLPDELEGDVFILSVKNSGSFLSDEPQCRKDFEEIFYEASGFVSEVFKKKLVLINR